MFDFKSVVSDPGGLERLEGPAAKRTENATATEIRQKRASRA